MQNSPYGLWTPWNASSHGGSIDSLNTILHWFMAILFVGWGIFFVYCLVRFRHREGHAASYQLPKGKVSKYAEIAVGIFELVLLLGFSMPVWAAYKNEKPPADKQVKVRVVAQQFEWNFHYPGKDGKYGRTDPKLMFENPPFGLDLEDPDAKDDIVSKQLFIPVADKANDVWVYAEISSKDVIHSFDIPVLRVKQDAVPGMSVPVWFQATRTTEEFKKALTREFDLDSKDFKRMQAVLVPLRDYNGKDGKPIVKANFVVSNAEVEALKAAGITRIEAAPGAATEVVCAQLCGNSHFKMKAPMFMIPAADFQKWMADAAEKKATTPTQSEDFE